MEPTRKFAMLDASFNLIGKVTKFRWYDSMLTTKDNIESNVDASLCGLAATSGLVVNAVYICT